MHFTLYTMASTALEEKVAYKFNEHRKLKTNISLVTHPGDIKKIILKKQRKSFRFIDLLRFENEKRMYSHLSRTNYSFLNIPCLYSKKEENSIYLEYIKGNALENFIVTGFAQGYIEFQHQEIPDSLWLDFLNQSLRGFDYKIGGVALLTISHRENLQLSAKILNLYNDLKKSQPILERKYWLHGDFHQNNFIVNSSGKVFFIDFENSFYTRRWPLCEILGECIKCTKKEIIFEPSVLDSYFQKLPINSSIRNLDFEKQLRFAILRKAIHVIIQTKYDHRREIYKSFIFNWLDHKSFHSWFIKHVSFNPNEIKIESKDQLMRV